MVRIFVYGSLMNGFWNYEQFLNGKANYAGCGEAKGLLFHLPEGFTAMLNGDGEVHGEVYEVADASMLERLDRLEGYYGPGQSNLYNRSMMDVVFADGTVERCFAYVYGNAEDARRRGQHVLNGDWRKFMNRGKCEMKYYFAYGSNMDDEQMMRRCVDAVCLGKARLDDYQFFINSRGVAGVEFKPEHHVEGILWSISEQDERSLDRHEGVSSGCYYKEMLYVSSEQDGKQYSLVYIPMHFAYGRPRENYLEKIIGAAEKHELNGDYIEGLREWAWKNHEARKSLQLSEVELNVLRELRNSEHKMDVFMLSNSIGVKIPEAVKVISHLTTENLIQQDRRDKMDGWAPGYSFYTAREKRALIDDLLEQDLQASVVHEAIDPQGVDYEHRTYICMDCHTRYHSQVEFCKSCMKTVVDIDTKLLDVILELNRKGYRTVACCSGHIKHGAYILFDGKVTLPYIPDRFALDKKVTMIASLSAKEMHLRKNANMSEEEKLRISEEDLKALRGWAFGLPEKDEAIRG